MNTPICDFVKKYSEKKTVRAHMPGHKGRAHIGPEPLDITEIAGADELFGAEGVIRESEENAAKLFGTKRTLYSAEGSSLCIRAMLSLALLNAKAEERAGHREKAERYTVIAGRNAHRAFVSACALLDLDIIWLWPENGGLLGGGLNARALDNALDELKQRPILCYVTSPDYLGGMEDIRGLSLVSHWHGVPFAVDNAHGAYLRFLPENRHPIALGADICCDSAHKTLGCLTGAAYLHISEYAPKPFSENAKRAMELFASTSPSYLVLQSLDAANARLENCGERFAAFAERMEALKQRLSGEWTLYGSEAFKLTVKPKDRGYTGQELAAELRERGIECEYADGDHTVLMLTPDNGEGDLESIENALNAIEKRAPIAERPPERRAPAGEKRAVTVREACFAPQRRVETEKAGGLIMGLDHCACPPAVPIVTAGERITEEDIALMLYYGKTECTAAEL